MSLKRTMGGEELGDEANKKIRMEYDPSIPEVRFLIEHHEAGAVIGKGGSKVVAIREATNCVLNIQKNESKQAHAPKQRVLLLKGSVENMAVAVQMMTTFWIEAANARAETTGDPAISDYSVKILLHKFQSGCIIGKAGVRIKELQSTTGARVQISNDCLPNSSEKAMSVSGTVDQVYAAALQAITLLVENPPRQNGSLIPYDPSTPAFPTAFPTNTYNPYQQPQLQAAAAYNAPNPYLPASANSYANLSAPSPQALAAAYGSPSGMAFSSQRLVIPSHMAGTIIGKGGYKIRELNQQSGTTIQIAKSDSSTPGERMVTVTGPSENISTAIVLLQQIIEQGVQ